MIARGAQQRHAPIASSVIFQDILLVPPLAVAEHNRQLLAGGRQSP
jgi:hypothetical protein